MKDISLQLAEWNAKAWSLNRSSPKEAIDIATQAISATKITKNLYQRAISRYVIGTSQIWISEYEKAIKNLHEARSYFEKENNTDYCSKCSYSLGTWYYYLSDFEESLNHYFESLRLCEQNNDIVGQANANNGIGSVYYEIENYEEARDVLLKSLHLIQSQEDAHIKTKILHGLGKSSFFLDDYKAAENYFNQCNALCKENDFKQELVFANEGLAILFLKLKKLDQLNEHLSIAINVARKIEFKIGLARILLIKGKSLIESDISEALVAFQESIEISNEINNLDVPQQFHQSMANYYEENNKLEETVFHLKKYQEFHDQIEKRKHGLHLKGLHIKINLERVEKENEIYKLKNEELNFRAEYLKETNKRIKTIGQIGQEIASKLDLEELLTLIYSKVNKLMSADVMYIGTYNEEEQIIDFPFYIKNGRRIHNISIPMDHRGKFTVWCIKNRKQMILNDFDKEASEYITLLDSQKKDTPPSSIMILPIIIKKKIIGVIGVHSFKKNSYTNEKVDVLKALAGYVSIALENARIYKDLNDLYGLIETKNNEILDSIRYAKRLQSAILPAKESILNMFPNIIVFYQPKDVVSGDFYWIKEINGRKYIAAADCTGHGVPGAMVSMVCANALNRTVNEFELVEPSDILNKARELVINTFATNKGFVYDGMDIALCLIEGKKLKFSGANRPLWIVRKNSSKHPRTITGNNNHQLIEFKPNKQSVGYADRNDLKPFTQIELKILPGDRVYLFSDGFTDQFGGEFDKKFKSKPLKSLLVSLADTPIKQQSESLEKTFRKWKNKQEQVDDVCIIGIEFD